MVALDNKVLLRHSTKFPTLCTLIVDGLDQKNSPTSTHSSRDPSQWLLPSGDPRDDARRLYRLHTLDIYFWTQEDADLFLDTVERYVPASQLETDRPVQQANDAGMSTVVQNLENMAVTDPTYQQAHQRDSGSEIASTPQSVPHPGSIHGSNPDQRTFTRGQELPAGYSPAPYNPAAPAAPEPIKHREKTPPPPDAANGTGLLAVELADQGQQYTMPPSAPPVGLPPSQLQGGLGAPHGFAAPMPNAGYSHRGSVSSQTSTVNSFAPPPTQPQNPNAHFLPQPSVAAQQHVVAGIGPSHEEGHEMPIGGYSNYSYANPPQYHYQQQAYPYQHNPQPQASEYDIHSQVYRPIDAEAHGHAQKDAKQAMKNYGSAKKYNFGNIASGMDRKMEGFLGRLEKKIG